jgi:F-type H+-transporting ATPase subunit alpha
LYEKLASAQPLSDEESDTVMTMIKTKLASVASTADTKTTTGTER